MTSASSQFPEFDHYVVARVLGEGGMGVVYEAHDRRTDLLVAIKVMSRHRWSDPDLRRRFLKENEILASLNHRNIVRCFEITQDKEGMPSIVMEYVRGVDFRAFEGKPYPELLPLMIQALMGLGYLKDRAIVHRDLSSNNILVTLEQQKRLVKIVDFGVAKVLQEKQGEEDFKTQTGQFLGKFSFSAPEVFMTGKVDWRSDVYSLGVIFHRLLYGVSPVRVKHPSNYYEWLTAHKDEVRLTAEAPHGCPPVPSALKDILLKMLAKRPETRPPSYEWIIGALDHVNRDTTLSGITPDPETMRFLPPIVERPSDSAHYVAETPSPPDVDTRRELIQRGELVEASPDTSVAEARRFAMEDEETEASAEPLPTPVRTSPVSSAEHTAVASPEPAHVSAPSPQPAVLASAPEPAPPASFDKTERLDDLMARLALREKSQPPVALAPSSASAAAEAAQAGETIRQPSSWAVAGETIRHPATWLPPAGVEASPEPESPKKEPDRTSEPVEKAPVRSRQGRFVVYARPEGRRSRGTRLEVVEEERELEADTEELRLKKRIKIALGAALLVVLVALALLVYWFVSQGASAQSDARPGKAGPADYPLASGSAS